MSTYPIPLLLCQAPPRPRQDTLTLSITKSAHPTHPHTLAWRSKDLSTGKHLCTRPEPSHTLARCVVHPQSGHNPGHQARGMCAHPFLRQPRHTPGRYTSTNAQQCHACGNAQALFCCLNPSSSIQLTKGVVAGGQRGGHDPAAPSQQGCFLLQGLKIKHVAGKQFWRRTGQAQANPKNLKQG